MHFEARGESLKKAQLDREKKPHHLRLFRSESDSEDGPRWILESHGSDTDPHPQQDEFPEGELGDQYLMDLLVHHILSHSITGRRRTPKCRHSTILEETNNE